MNNDLDKQKPISAPSRGAAIGMIIVGGLMLCGAAYLAWRPKPPDFEPSYGSNPGRVLAIIGGLVLLQGIRTLQGRKG